MLAAFLLAAWGVAWGHGTHTTALDGEEPHAGVMFDLVALADLEVQGLGVKLPGTDAAVVDVWVREGSHVGHERDPAGWRRLGSSVVTGAGPRRATVVPIPMQVAVGAGEVSGWYVEVTSGGPLVVSEGARTGAVYSELPGEMRVEVGTALDGHFSRPVPGRIFNGDITFVAVVPHAPFGKPQSVTATAGEPLTVVLEGHDVDGDPVSAVVEGGPSHGTIEAIGPSRYVYVPDAGYAGPDAFTFRTSDGVLTSPDVATVTIEVVPPTIVVPNDPPVADAGAPEGGHVVAEGAYLALDGSRSYDPDGRVVEWRWDCESDGRDDGAGATGRTCAYPDDGIWPLTLRVLDDRRASATDVVEVRVENVAPRVRGSVAPEAGEGTFRFDAPAVDPGDDVLGWIWDFGDGTAIERGHAPSAVHTYARNGRYDAVVTVVDDDGGQGSVALVVRVVDAPTPVCEVER